jgi:hypothetical protein
MEKVQNIYQRLVKFQSLISRINKDNNVDFTANGRRIKYSFSSLDEIQLQIQPHLKEAGLGYMQPITEKGIKTIIFDVDGNTIESENIPINFNQEMQKIGSAITYARRYSLTSMLGIIVGDEDDDGLLGNNNTTTVPKPISKPQKPTFELTEKSEGWIMEQLGEKELKDIILSIKKIRTLSPEVEKQINNKFAIINDEELQVELEEIKL